MKDVGRVCLLSARAAGRVCDDVQVQRSVPCTLVTGFTVHLHQEMRTQPGRAAGTAVTRIRQLV